MFIFAVLPFLLLICRLITPGAAFNVRRNDGSGFVTVVNGQFHLDGRLFFHYGTNAYWLIMLNDNDLETTFKSFSNAGVRVVRTWAFNDVAKKPSSGPYFQIINNCTTTINDGPDGLQRLDKVVATAEKYGIKLILSLTNNWNPPHTVSDTPFKKRNNASPLPRGYLSNDYGGMDLYVQQFVPNGTHDLFYTDDKIVSAFKNYVKHVISRYTSSPAIFAWELANDPRCASTFPASHSCNPQTITEWAAGISGFIKSCDNNHLVTPGDGGFYCLGCPKLFEGGGGSKWKRDGFCGIDTRYPTTGPGFDGSYGVDTEDLLSIPSIDFGSLQLFPDQDKYYAKNRSNIFVIEAIAQGDAWIEQHADTATQFCKPVEVTAFSIVPKTHWDNFVPFTATARVPHGPPGSGGVSAFEHDYTYASWGTDGFTRNIGGMLEYQWIQPVLSGVPNVTSLVKRDGSSPDDGNYGDVNSININEFAAKNN